MPSRTYEPTDRMAAAIAPATAKKPTADSKTVAKVVKIVKKPAPKPVQLRARPPIDDQFSATLDFSPAYGSDAGRTYGPLMITPGAGSPEGSKEFYVRCMIEQHRVDPLLQGFKTLWEPPTGWTIADGCSATLYDEAISNPVYITRVYLTPAAPTVDVGFRVIVEAKYRP
jgi:hypothetical protein